MPDPHQDADPTPVTTGAAPRVANPAPLAGDVRIPSNRELARLRKARFGDGAGAVQLDVDPRGGSVTLVYLDGAGKELAREPFNPGGPPPSPVTVPEPARKPPPAPPPVPPPPPPPPPPPAPTPAQAAKK